ncbi:MAG: cyclic-di-AMP receptor, partial [Clostridia bacterium]|nr:cyclic-di-AMP receptor [Clostridia bacterium]
MNVSFPILCLIVCAGRIIDVALGTVRTVFNVRGKSYVATAIAFVEATIWFLVVREALSFEAQGMEVYLIAIAYALGFSLGTFCGGLVTSKLIKSKINVQIVTTYKNDEFVKALSEAGFGATVLEATGTIQKEERYMILIETDNKRIKLLNQIIKDKAP